MDGIYALNQNVIGAFIITILFLGFLIRRPPLLKESEELFSKFNLILNYLLIAFLICLLLRKAELYFTDNSLLGWSDVFLSGFIHWVHEAGHIYWSIFGDFIASLGGTLNEILFSLGFFCFCLHRNYISLAGLFIYYLGYNLFHTAWYIASSSTSPEKIAGGTHDWKFMLGKFDLIQYEQDIALFVRVLAWCFAIVGIFIFSHYGKKLTISSEIEIRTKTDFQ